MMKPNSDCSHESSEKPVSESDFSQVFRFGDRREAIDYDCPFDDYISLNQHSQSMDIMHL